MMISMTLSHLNHIHLRYRYHLCKFIQKLIILGGLENQVLHNNVEATVLPKVMSSLPEHLIPWDQRQTQLNDISLIDPGFENPCRKDYCFPQCACVQPYSSSWTVVWSSRFPLWLQSLVWLGIVRHSKHRTPSATDCFISCPLFVG